MPPRNPAAPVTSARIRRVGHAAPPGVNGGLRTGLRFVRTIPYGTDMTAPSSARTPAPTSETIDSETIVPGTIASPEGASRQPASLKDRLLRRLALRYRAWARRRSRSGVEAVLRAARATMRRKRYCLLVTAGEDGPGARVLQPFPPGPDLTVWMGTSPHTRKAAALRADPRATLVYQDDGKAACVVLSGRVELVEEIAERRRRFMPTWWAFWPEGPEGADFVLLRFAPERLEVWDASRRITPEPFGLRSARLVLRDGTWREA